MSSRRVDADRLQQPPVPAEPGRVGQLGRRAGGGQRPHVPGRVGARPAPAAVGRRRPRAPAAPRAAVTQFGTRAAAAGRRATASIATCAVMSQLPSGTGRDLPPAAEPGQRAERRPVVRAGARSRRRARSPRRRGDRVRPGLVARAGRSRPGRRPRRGHHRGAARPRPRRRPCAPERLRRRWPGRPARTPARRRRRRRPRRAARCPATRWRAAARRSRAGHVGRQPIAVGQVASGRAPARPRPGAGPRLGHAGSARQPARAARRAARRGRRRRRPRRRRRGGPARRRPARPAAAARRRTAARRARWSGSARPGRRRRRRTRPARTGPVHRVRQPGSPSPRASRSATTVVRRLTAVTSRSVRHGWCKFTPACHGRSRRTHTCASTGTPSEDWIIDMSASLRARRATPVWSASSAPAGSAPSSAPRSTARRATGSSPPPASPPPARDRVAPLLPRRPRSCPADEVARGRDGPAAARRARRRPGRPGGRAWPSRARCAPARSSRTPPARTGSPCSPRRGGRRPSAGPAPGDDLHRRRRRPGPAAAASRSGVTAPADAAPARHPARRRPRRRRRSGSPRPPARSTTRPWRTARTTWSRWSTRRPTGCATPGSTHPEQVLGPLLRAALDNALRLGDAALTGPVSRGDAGTVAGTWPRCGPTAPDSRAGLPRPGPAHRRPGHRRPGGCARTTPSRCWACWPPIGSA